MAPSKPSSSRSVRGWIWRAGAPARLLIVGAIYLYRATLGAAASGRCRFYPSCSAYALEAVQEWGAVRGGGLALWRILRCSPLTAGGIDQPPKRRASSAMLYDPAIQLSRDDGRIA